MLPNKLFGPITFYIYYSSIENSEKGAGIYRTEFISKFHVILTHYEVVFVKLAYAHIIQYASLS